MGEKELREAMISTYGNVKLDKQERMFLSLGPEFTVLDRIDQRKIKGEFQAALTKIRWSRLGKEPEEVLREVEDNELKEEEDIDKISFLENRVFDEEAKTVRMEKVRCTDMKVNRRIVFPGGRNPKEEAEIEVRKQTWLEIVNKYISENCKNEEKEQDLTKQMSGDQIAGRKKLQQRVRKGEIHISCSDKGKRVVVMPLDMYEKVTARHTVNDKKVTWSELRESQKTVTAHSRALAKIFRIGASLGPRNQSRCHNNCTTWAQDPPTLRSAAKTHKPAQEDGTPKTRPIVAATRGMGTALGEILSDLVAPISRTRESQKECQSTEEMVTHIQEANKKIEESNKDSIMVGSMDVEALYPSIHQREGARIVAEEIVKSDIKYEGVDVRKAAVYLATTLDKERQTSEGIAHLLPVRKAKGRQGRKPTIRSKELGGPLPKPEKEELGQEELPGFEEGGGVIGTILEDQESAEGTETKWIPMGREYTDREGKVLVAKVIMVAIETSFGEHIYEFGGELYKQLEGGAIGVRLTGEVAKLIMDRWADDMGACLRASKVEVYMLCKYVDDINLATQIIPPVR